MLQGRLNSAMSNLAADRDREVAAAAMAMSDAYRKVPVRMLGAAGAQGLLRDGPDHEARDRDREAAESEVMLNPEEVERYAVAKAQAY